MFKVHEMNLKTTARKFKRESSSSSSEDLCYQQQKAKRQNIKSSIIQQADKFRFTLDAKYPSFTKYLMKSHVSSCFWMGLPNSFCKMYLPQKDTYFILLTQNGEQYTAKYLADKTALSGGWKGFAIAEKLSEGDALVFHLLTPAKFKVYIIKKSNLAGNDGSHVTLNFPTQGIQSVNAEALDEKQEVLCYDNEPQISQLAGISEKGTYEFESFNSRSSKHVVCPAAVGDCGTASFEEFVILIDELLKKEYELPHNIKHSYYQLCCSQNSLLHFQLLKGINPFLIAGSIIETVSVAAAIGNCELHGFHDELPIWDEKLKSLKILGMEVDFLLSHLDHLQRIAYDPEVANNMQHFSDLCLEHADSENKMQTLETQLSELTRMVDKRADDIEKLKLEIENHKSRFQEQVSAPW